MITNDTQFNYLFEKIYELVELADFRECWGNFVECNPHFRGDSIAKRTAFNDYVDGLNKDGLVTDYQAYNWSNPF